MYPHFWCDCNVEHQFDAHLWVLIDAYGYEKLLGKVVTSYCASFDQLWPTNVTTGFIQNVCEI